MHASPRTCLTEIYSPPRLSLPLSLCLGQYDSGDSFIGASTTSDTAPSFFLQGFTGYSAEDSTGYGLIGWFFQYVFAAAAATSHRMMPGSPGLLL